MTSDRNANPPPAVPGAAGGPQHQAGIEEKESAMGNNTSNTLMAFLLGAATGGIATLLLAPTSGRELREKLGEGAEKTRAATIDAARQAGEKATAKYEEATERAREVATGARESAEAHGKAVKEAVKEGKAAYDRELAKAG